MVFEPAIHVGNIWSLTSLCNELYFGRLAGVFRSDKRQLDVEGLLRTFVFGRICDPETEPGCSKP